MKNYIMLDGRKFEIDEKNSTLLRAVVDEEKEEKKNPLSRQKNGGKYYYIGRNGDVYNDVEAGFPIDDRGYNVANYCRDEKLMGQRALHETLNRLLWRFPEENGGDNDWGKNANHYVIYHYKGGKDHYNVASYTYVSYQGAVYFSSEELAYRAIEEIVNPFVAKHPDFVW